MTVVAAVAYYKLLAKPLFAEVPEQNGFQRLMEKMKSSRPMVWLRTEVFQQIHFKVQDKVHALYEQGVFYRDMLKIIVNFLQIIGSFARIDLNFPTQFGDLMKAFSIAELSSELPATACLLSSVTFYDNLLAYTLLPVIIIIVMALPTLYANFRSHSQASKVLDKFVIWALVFTNLIYPNVSRVVLMTLQCDNVPEVGRFLAADYRVSCDNEKYKVYRTYAYFAIAAWPLGFPVFCIALLVYYKVPHIAARKLKRAELRAFLQYSASQFASLGKPPLVLGNMHSLEMDDLSLEQLRLLAESFGLCKQDDIRKLRQQVSENWVLARQTSIYDASTSSEVAIACSSTTSSNSLSKQDLVVRLLVLIDEMKVAEQLVVPALEWNAESDDEEERLAMAHVGILISAYEPKYYWFELWILCHKLMLISFIPTMVSDSSASFLLISFLFEFVNIIFTCQLKPFADPSLDRLNLGTLVVICLVLLYGIMLLITPNVTTDPRDRQIQGILLVIMNVGVILSAPIQFCIERTAELLALNEVIKTSGAAISLRVLHCLRPKPAPERHNAPNDRQMEMEPSALAPRMPDSEQPPPPQELPDHHRPIPLKGTPLFVCMSMHTPVCCVPVLAHVGPPVLFYSEGTTSLTDKVDPEKSSINSAQADKDSILIPQAGESIEACSPMPWQKEPDCAKRLTVPAVDCQFAHH